MQRKSLIYCVGLLLLVCQSDNIYGNCKQQLQACEVRSNDQMALCDDDVSIYRFNNRWRDVGDIRREFEDKDNFNLLAEGFNPPATPNVDVQEPEDPYVFDIRNVLLPSGPLIHANSRSYDAYKYGTDLDKMIYVMRKKSGYRDFVGFIVFYQQPHNMCEGYIEMLLISKPFRGSQSGVSYASLLMNKAVQALKGKGASKVILTTSSDNVRAQKFYENKMGFVERPPRYQTVPGMIFYEKDI